MNNHFDFSDQLSYFAQMNSKHPLEQDLNHILQQASSSWENLRGSRVFITGGTGFFGSWLLESFVWANEKLKLGSQAVVLTRDPQAFLARFPHLSQTNCLQFVAGDVRTFSYPSGQFSHMIHAATAANAKMNIENPQLMADTILEGTQQALNFAALAGVKRFLFVSSGAIYGKQPSDITHISEEYTGAPDPMAPASAYGEGKRMAELLCAIRARATGMEVTSARCFAFVGPYLPLDGSFAIGNFIQNCIKSQPIQIGGDGTPFRSYLYAADLTIWLWSLLVHGVNCRAYNVGSEQHLSIAELASQVSQALSANVPIEIAKKAAPGQLPERYVPSTQRVQKELQLKQTVDLPEAIRRTAAWYSSKI
jgi:dTDP-glucose 4,6-dehydratase